MSNILFPERYLTVINLVEYSSFSRILSSRDSARILSPEKTIYKEHCLRAIVISNRMRVSVKHAKQFLPVHLDNRSEIRKYAITVAVHPHHGKFQVMFQGDWPSAISKIDLQKGNCLELCKFLMIMQNKLISTLIRAAFINKVLRKPAGYTKCNTYDCTCDNCHSLYNCNIIFDKL